MFLLSFYDKLLFSMKFANKKISQIYIIATLAAKGDVINVNKIQLMFKFLSDASLSKYGHR